MNDELQQADVSCDGGPQADAGTAEAAATTSASERWGTSYAYSRVLSSSMKKIMTTRPRMMAMKVSVLGGSAAEDAPDGTNTGHNRQQEVELFARFADAASRKDKDGMLTQITQHAQLVRFRDAADQIPLHLVCGLAPIHFYVDLIDAIVQADEESPASMDKFGQTPLHVLCRNVSVTSEALNVLLAAMPASAVMCDKHSNLAVHYLCLNPSCTLDMLWSLGQPGTYAMKNEDTRSPLHCLSMALTSPNREVFLHLLSSCPTAAAGLDSTGRSVLHWVCESDLFDLELLSKLLPLSGNAPSQPDQYRDLPLHLLCQNASIGVEMLRMLLHANPNAVYAHTENNLTALHLLCGNASLSADHLDAMLAYDKTNTTPSLSDTFGATPLHILCMNEAITPTALRALLVVSTNDSFARDVHGRSPMHYLCMNRAISSELVWLFLERAQDLVREVDSVGKTPLHHLCANKSVMAGTLEILYDACPSATVVADKELRLPIQYLVDNPLSPPETTALLISGPASYRLRYDFLSAVGGANALSFLRGDELVYAQTNLAMDSKASNSKVWIKFLSSGTALDHEHAMIARLNTVSQRLAAKATEDIAAKDYSLKVYEDFDDAKRRVNVRHTPASVAVAPEDHIADTSVTLHYGIVTEAPSYTLETLNNERIIDLTSVWALISEVGECLEFWHREALMIHGNVSLECIGHFAERGLRLVHFHTSREFHEHAKLGAQAVKTTSLPPEAARAFLANEGFEPTTASDVWQFGCLVFQLTTGKSLLAALAPWSEGLGQTQLLHLISSVTDDVIKTVLVGVDDSLRGLLQATLVTNPTQRWTIDRLMHIDALKSSGEAGSSSDTASEDLHTRLQRRADSELLNAEYQRSAKHAQDQLDFAKKEQSLLRAQFLTTKMRLRECEEAGERLRTEVAILRDQLNKIRKQKHEVQQEVRVFARTHQSMTQQLHTTMQMLLNLVPLAKKVYGTNADEFLSRILAESTGSEAKSLSTINIGSGSVVPAGLDIVDGGVAGGPSLGGTAGGRPRRKSAVDVVKSQLQNSILAHGCIHTWANSSQPSPSALEPHGLSFSSRSEDDTDEAQDKPEVDDYGDDSGNQQEIAAHMEVPGMWDICLADDNQHEQQSEERVRECFQAGCFLIEADDTEAV